MWTYWLLGLSTGLSAGLSPGPLMALVVAASVRSGVKGGLRVALAPLLTDVPIVAVAVFVAGRLPPVALRWVATVGGAVVIGLGVEILRKARRATLPTGEQAAGEPRRELWRGVMVNALNPHPYLFWVTVGAPAIVSAWRISPWASVAFVAAFYTMLLGSKIAVAWLVGRHAGRLPVAWYRRTLAACGVLMVCMGGLFIYQGWAGAR